MAFSDILQQIANGLILGSFYALVALGYSMVYGIIKLLNFAHGDVYMMGAFVGFLALALDLALARRRLARHRTGDGVQHDRGRSASAC